MRNIEMLTNKQASFLSSNRNLRKSTKKSGNDSITQTIDLTKVFDFKISRNAAGFNSITQIIDLLSH
jgi:hypothetical protein